MPRSAALICLAATVAWGSLVACSGGGPGPAGQTPAGQTPAVVASTDVWGSVARAVAGVDAAVSSIINGPVDPHSYEPSPAAVAAVEDATVVVYNGGGYDTWIADIADRRPRVTTVNAVELLDNSSPGDSGRTNEHVFYDLPTAKAVAYRIAEVLSARDAAHADGYRLRAAEFGRSADEILTREKDLRTESAGAGVVATEPVAHYLLATAGLTDMTPAGFTNAIEQDSDPAPADMAAVLDLINRRRVSVLVVNDQTMTGAVRQIRDAASRAGVPVVGVTETLPAGTDYLSWQSATVDRLAAALRESP